MSSSSDGDAAEGTPLALLIAPSSSLSIASLSKDGPEDVRGIGRRFVSIDALFRPVFTGNSLRGAAFVGRLLLALPLEAVLTACCLRCCRRSNSCCCAWSSINDTVSLNMDRLELLGFSGVVCADLLLGWRAPKSESSSSSDAMFFRLRAVRRLGIESSEPPSSLEIARRRFLPASGRVARDGAGPSSLESSRTITSIGDAAQASRQQQQPEMQTADRYLALQQWTPRLPAIERPQQSPRD